MQIAEEIDAVGGELNAFTAKEHTCYYAHVLDTDLPLAMDLRVPTWSFDATAAPSGTWRSSAAWSSRRSPCATTTPRTCSHDAFVEALLGDHPLGRPVLGTEESISGDEPDVAARRSTGAATRCRGWCSRRRATSRTARCCGTPAGCCATGSVGDRPPGGPRRRAGRGSPRPQKLVLHTDDTEQAHLMLGVRALDRHDERRWALGVLNTALGGGMSSRLFQEVRERRGLAYQVYSSVASYADTGHLSVYAGCQPDRLGSVAGVVHEVLADVARDGLTDAEVARAQGAAARQPRARSGGHAARGCRGSARASWPTAST